MCSYIFKILKFKTFTYTFCIHKYIHRGNSNIHKYLYSTIKKNFPPIKRGISQNFYNNILKKICLNILFCGYEYHDNHSYNLCQLNMRQRP